MRLISLQEACREYPFRYTLDHAPVWAGTPAPDGRYYAPQYASDVEWYNNTFFPGEPGHPHYSAQLRRQRGGGCYSSNATWPLGQWLDKPYRNPRRSA